jgi:chorismate synthase
MSSNNTFGRYFSWMSFGESHGPAMGVVIDGCPGGVELDIKGLQADLNRRRPGQVDAASGKVLVTERDEKDQVEILSGVYEGKTLGTPIACVVRNEDQRSQDYEKIKKESRIGHADDMWKEKFAHVDPRGGGRSSGRETLSRVVAGSVARQFLHSIHPTLKVTGFAAQIGAYAIENFDREVLNEKLQSSQHNNSIVDGFAARFPSKTVNIAEHLQHAKDTGESYGGVVEIWIDGAPQGLGEPVFHKLKSDLAMAVMSIGATCGVEFGEGFALTKSAGTEVHTQKNSPAYGGIRGGISTGERIAFRVAFKPTSSITDTSKQGRHDPCIVPRAVPVVEAMTWAVLADLELARRLN